jgi:M-phase inducer tyrosine phosphatase
MASTTTVTRSNMSSDSIECSFISTRSGNDLEMSSPAAQAFAKCQSMRTICRRDGTEDFRPLTGATTLLQRDLYLQKEQHSPRNLRSNTSIEGSPSTKGYFSADISRFGNNEAPEKILPDHYVSEDGLMRIKCSTVSHLDLIIPQVSKYLLPQLDTLLNGAYDSQITKYIVIDCCFNYKYVGGHIQGAINMNISAAVEQFLLGLDSSKPLPSTSGDKKEKTILVFHCKFSSKCAPTL